jgi:trigger factor
MKIETNILPKSQIEFSIELSKSDMDPYLDLAARAISQNPIKGFRPGFAPIDVVMREFGEEKVKKLASESAITENIKKAIAKNNIDYIGDPKVSDVKNEDGSVSFKAILSVIPKIKLGDYKKIKIPSEKFEVEEKEIEDVLENLRKSRAQNSVVSRSAQKGDRIEIDFTVKKGDKKIEGGDSKQHPIILGENNFIPGFEENLIGLKENEEKSFSLLAPEDYHDKNLAGEKLDFEVKVHQVQERKIPDLNDDFAKSLGKFVSVKELRNNINEGLKMEKEMKAHDERRAKITEALVSGISEELPEELVKIEMNKMFMELSESLGRMNLTLENYLNHLNKTPEELTKDWDPQARKRIKAALALKEIAQKEGIKVEDQEVEDRLGQILRNAPPMQPGQNLDLTTIRGYVKGIIRNEKVFELLESSH